VNNPSTNEVFDMTAGNLEINAYMLIESDSPGDHQGAAESVQYELSERDGGFRIVEWAHIYKTYPTSGTLWFSDDKDYFIQAAEWSKERYVECEKRVKALVPDICSWLKEEKASDDLILWTANKILLENGSWHPFSFFWDSMDQSSEIVDFCTRIDEGEDFTDYALAPITINLWDSWTYDIDALSKLLSGIDLKFPFPTK
jgi:hypothetical protein